MRNIAILGMMIVASVATAGNTTPSPFAPLGRIGLGVPSELVFTYASSYPASIKLGTAYEGPAKPGKASWNSGDGWHTYTSNTIPLHSGVLRFRGDWRTSSGSWQNMFRGSFMVGKPVTVSGGFTVGSSYVSGAPAADMFSGTFSNCRGLTGSIPSGLFGALSGVPAANMFNQTFSNCSGLTGGDVVIPAGVSLTSANVVRPFSGMFQNASAWTGQLYWGTNVIHTVITPASDINTFQNCYLMPDYATIHAFWK